MTDRNHFGSSSRRTFIKAAGAAAFLAGAPMILADDKPGDKAPIVGEGAKQSLKVRLSWPSPAPHAPLFVWFRGEDVGRATKLRY